MKNKIDSIDVYMVLYQSGEHNLLLIGPKDGFLENVVNNELPDLEISGYLSKIGIVPPTLENPVDGYTSIVDIVNFEKKLGEYNPKKIDRKAIPVTMDVPFAPLKGDEQWSGKKLSDTFLAEEKGDIDKGFLTRAYCIHSPHV